MKVVSFIRQGFELFPVEVELSLTAGLPQIVFMGLPDAMIRESVTRIKSALKHQGFEFPAARQVLVHLRPTHLRKSSRGLDLAVAAALLWEMGQVPAPEGPPPVVYGELSLKGEVLRPDDLEDLDALFVPPTGVITGPGQALGFPVSVVRELKWLAQPEGVSARSGTPVLERPLLPDLRLNPEAAQVLAVIAAGEHAALFAGPPGSGKTTAAELAHRLLEDAQDDTWAATIRIHRAMGETPPWRPLIQPHHSITPLAMIGGGSPPSPGEITRAHGGVLIMDEFLEFDRAVQEALREPLETGWIRIARGGHCRRYPARFLAIATTNLCLCGRYLPGRDELCRCSRADKRRYLSRLRGPCLDRFAMVAFTDKWGREQSVPVHEIRERVARAARFRRESRGQEVVNAYISEAEAGRGLNEFQRKNLMPSTPLSRRRYVAMLRLARTLADLDESEAIGNRHLEQALALSVRSFKELEHADA